MVHALREAHRVLRPDGVLVDLRPGTKHRRVGLGQGRRWRLVGVMRESFDEDWAANRAVTQALRQGWFRRGRSTEFLLDRAMDTLGDFHRWLEEFGQRHMLASHEWLIRRLERALARNETTIVVRGPVTLKVLHKIG